MGAMSTDAVKKGEKNLNGLFCTYTVRRVGKKLNLEKQEGSIQVSH